MPLKKAIGILFLGIYLFTSTELRQLVKLPLLVQHYAEHKREKGDLTIWQFLAMHYENSGMVDMDYAKDQQLPFKSHDGCAGSFLNMYVPASFYTLVARSFYPEPVNHVVSNEDFINSVYLSSIWQPPKAC